MARSRSEIAADVETRARPDDHQSLRLWLRLLACTQLIETQVRHSLKSAYGTTLPRFDLMAQLDRSVEGLKMGELSRRMMVTGGNVTGITDMLEVEGLVVREPDPADRRACRVRLTPEGNRQFRRMAAEHERWVIEAARRVKPAAARSAGRTAGCGQGHGRAPLEAWRGVGARHGQTDMIDAGYMPAHFRWRVEGRVGVITLDRPERKNPLTFESYAELRDLFRALNGTTDVKAVVLTGAGGNFCSGGDVHEIIAPLTRMAMDGLLAFTRMTGDLVKAMRACPQPIAAAVDGVCAGAGAILAMASDLRYATPAARTAFLFTRVGLAGCDMGACSILPRIIGHGRAAELLYTGRAMSAEEGFAWGFYNQLVSGEELLAHAPGAWRNSRLVPTFAHAMTKRMLHQEWNLSIDAALDAEAEAQAICMQTGDFRRAYAAFVARQQAVFEGS